MILETWPTKIRSGDTLRFKVKIDGYDSTIDTLIVYISNQNNGYNFTAVDDSGYFYFDVEHSTTATFVPSDYHLQASITQTDGARYTVYQSQITVLPDLRIGNTDPRSHVKRVLDAIEAVIENSASSDVQEYEIDNRRLVKMSKSELLILHSKYKRMYAQECGQPTKIRYHFK